MSRNLACSVTPRGPLQLGGRRHGTRSGSKGCGTGRASSEQPARRGPGRLGELLGPRVQLIACQRWREEPVGVRDEEPLSGLLAGRWRASPLVCGAGQQLGGQVIEPVLELVVPFLRRLVHPLASLSGPVPAYPLPVPLMGQLAGCPPPV